MSVYNRRKSISVSVGGTAIGGSNPIRLQSMTTTATMDTQGCIEQAIRIIEAGGELVRMTTQGTREAENMRLIREGLTARGYNTPLVADVHFNPAVADVAARYVEKVRINPGNYVDPARTFRHLEYTDAEYAQEIQRIRDRFIPFLNICREHGTAIRIGVNHGSLSDRIMSRYGNTPAGMVESCMEFLRICVEQDFMNSLHAFIQDHISETELTIDRLADAMAVSRATLTRKVKANTGLTVNEYVRISRLKKAVELLAENNYRINEVAYLVGYTSPSYFTLSFQKQFGMLPSEFIKDKTQ